MAKHVGHVFCHLFVDVVEDCLLSVVIWRVFGYQVVDKLCLVSTFVYLKQISRALRIYLCFFVHFMLVFLEPMSACYNLSDLDCVGVQAMSVVDSSEGASEARTNTE